MLRVALASLLSLALSSHAAFAQETNISGSTSVARVMDVLAEEYTRLTLTTILQFRVLALQPGLRW